MGLGEFLLVRSLVIAGGPIERSAIWPQLLILSAIVVFELLIERLGLAAAVAAVALISGFAARDMRWLERIVLALSIGGGMRRAVRLFPRPADPGLGR